MDVRNLETSQGMLFIFDRQEVQSFWMANTPLPLDLLFADENRTIVHIHTNARPYSRIQSHRSNPAKYVVEVNAGYAMARDLQVGHTISYTDHQLKNPMKKLVLLATLMIGACASDNEQSVREVVFTLKACIARAVLAL